MFTFSFPLSFYQAPGIRNLSDCVRCCFPPMGEAVGWNHQERGNCMEVDLVRGKAPWEIGMLRRGRGWAGRRAQCRHISGSATPGKGADGGGAPFVSFTRQGTASHKRRLAVTSAGVEGRFPTGARPCTRTSTWTGEYISERKSVQQRTTTQSCDDPLPL